MKVAPRMIAVIPARYDSTRFPGKVLVPINGKPMLQRVFEQACSCPGFDKVVIATDDDRIIKVALGFGAEVISTPRECRTGSDRVAAVAVKILGDIFLNIQADYPDISPTDLEAVAEYLIAHPEVPMATLCQAFTSETERNSPHHVKIYFDADGFAVKFTREFPSPPSGRTGLGERETCYEHIGVYGFQREALLEFAKLPQSPLEKKENLEQLRAWENGMRMKVIAARQLCHGINVPEDIKE